jgi:aspartyl-tRNA(Asn)/glutamyl-tRNA(Gln) amidotransferase subunit B
MYSPVIGLEVHTQLKTKSKMFCSCINNPEDKNPNIYVCPVCLAHPGTLPTINKEAVVKVLFAGKALNCTLQDISHFDRKNYFYPDLPKGYQISQDKKPFCVNGYLEIDGKKIRINRIHLEEDTGRLIHNEKQEHSLVDFNRAGIPLMELVTEPDIRSGEEARKFAEELRLILRYLDVSDANMEQGQMRVEVNISISKEGEKFGTKVEIKNLNSFRTVCLAVDYEIKRQTEVLEKGEKVIQETRGWDDKNGKTFSQREKESAHDYRYFPEPDLPPLFLNEAPFNKNELKIEIELPQEKRKRFKEEYRIENEKEIEVFIINRDIADYFEEVAKKTKEKEIFQIIKNYLLTDVLGMLNGEDIKKIKMSPDDFLEFANLIFKKEISSKVAKDVLKEMIISGTSASKIIKKESLSKIDDKEEVKSIILETIKENEKAVKDYKEGKKEALTFLIGRVMAKTKGRVNPEEAKIILIEILKVDLLNK